LDICNGPISLAQTGNTLALYGKVFGLKVTSLSYYGRNAITSHRYRQICLLFSLPIRT